MSKTSFGLNKEFLMAHSYSMKNFNKNKDKNVLSPKNNSNFKKVTDSGTIGISGNNPIIIYKKTSKGRLNKEKYEVQKQIRNTNYISDGGLKEKIEKFNYGYGYVHSSIPLPQNSQIKTTKNKYNKDHNLFFEEKQNGKESLQKSKKLNNTDKKLFSKTVRDFNKRPIFRKNGEKIKNSYQSKNGFGLDNNNAQEVNKNQEDSKVLEDIKYEYMKKLYKNGIENEIRKYQIEKKMTSKEIQNERKKVCLLDNGIEIENELNDIQEEGNLNEEIKEEELSNNIEENNVIKTKSPTNSLLKSHIEINNNNNMASLDNQSIISPKIKKIYKSPVNQFEFIKKIKKEQQKLSGSVTKQNSKKKITTNKTDSLSLNDSFRHKKNKNYNHDDTSLKEKSILKNNYINNNNKNSKDNPVQVQGISEETQSTNDNYPYSHKKSHRSAQELKDFLKLKRLKEKEDKKSKEIENSKKLFVRFKNLYNLSMKDLLEDQIQKIEPHPKGKMTKSKSSSNYNYGNLIRRKKELNEYYIGSEHSTKNNSTLVDQSEYFLHILESQQLLVNSKLKRIDNIFDTESSKVNDGEKKNNESNISKDRNKNILDKESKKSENSTIKLNNDINIDNYDELKEKIDNTLKRINKVFSKENLQILKDENMLINNIRKNINANNIKDIIKGNNNDKNEDKIMHRKNDIKNKNSENNKKSNDNNKDLKIKPHEIDIDITNAENKLDNILTNSEINTKEKNIPSLSHTYSTNSNPNIKVEIEIEPRAVLNLVEILKFIIQRKIFVMIYESYINQSIFQQYNIALSYFIAICKQYPFRKIEEYANYKTYNFAFRQLFRPFTRKAFKYFLTCCYMKKQIEYLVILLTKIFKFKVLEKIYLSNYKKYYEEDNKKAYKIIIMKILTTLIRPHLKQCFKDLKNQVKVKKKENKDKTDKKDLKKEDKKENFSGKSNNKVKLKDDKTENEINDKNDNNSKKNSISENKSLSDKANKDKNKDNNKKEEDFFESEPVHRRADVSMKMNSFMNYTSENDSKSSMSIEPNSLDNDKLHKLKKKLESKNKIGNEDDFFGLDSDFSSEPKLHRAGVKDYKNKKKKFLNLINSDLFENNSKKSKPKSKLDNKSDKQNESQNSKNNKNKKNINIKKEILENKKLKKNKLEEDEDKKDKDKSVNKEINKDEIKNDNNITDNKDKNTNKNANDNNIKDIEDNKKDNKKDNEKNKDLKIEDKNKNKKEDKIEDKKENKNENKKEDDKSADTTNSNKKANKKENVEEKKRNIKIEIDDIPIIKNEIQSNKYSSSEKDVSAENDLNQNIDWEYNVSSTGNSKQKQNKIEKINNMVENFLDDIEDIVIKSKKNKVQKDEDAKEKEKEKEKGKGKEKNEDVKRTKSKESKKSDDEYGSFDDLSLEDIENKEDNKENFGVISNDNKQDKSRNSKPENKEIKNELKEINEDIKIDNKIENKNNDKIEDKKEIVNNNDDKFNLEKIKSIENPEKFSENLTEEIIKNICSDEIKSHKTRLIPNKKFKFDKFDKLNNNGLNNSLTNSYGSVGDMRSNTSNLSKEFGMGNVSQMSMHDDLLLLNESLMSNYSTFSVFNKTVKDKKKEHSQKLYIKKIAPILIKLLYKQICNKFPLIYDNISKPLQNNSDKFMISLAMQDAEMLKDNYKCSSKAESIEKIIDKENLLKQFSKINLDIRNKDNVISDNFYDNMLNDCIIDTAIELIYKERIYGKNGNPLKWSSRTHELTFKFDKNEPKKFAAYICQKILKILHNRIGLITENYDFMSSEQINMEKDRRLLKVLKKDLNDNEYQWNNLELEETQLKIESTELILEQLYNEIIEILEHIQFSRIRPELYQNKSIYACEEIPKLSFQETTTENNVNGMEDEGDDNVINI